MKIVKSLIVVFLVAIAGVSCSDKLTEAKVKKIVNSCLEKAPLHGTHKLQSGKRTSLTKSEEEQYQKLAEKGLLTIEQKEEHSRWFTSKYHLISLTDKSKDYIIESEEGYGGNHTHKIRLYTYELDEVGGIQEIPAMNVCEVSLTYKKSDKTPFYDALESDKTDFIKKKIVLKKTENKGWIYCD